MFQATGNQVYDGLASVSIGVLLAVVAVALGRDTKNLLIGEAATPEERKAITEIIEAHPGRRPRARAADHGALAPDRLLVAARVDLADGLSADEIERASSEIDRELRERIPTVWQVFLDATPPRSEAARRRETDRKRPTPERRLIACPARRRSRRRPAWRRRCASPPGPRGPRAGPRRPRSRARSVAAPISDDLDVGQPQRALGRALDDAAAEPAAQLEREVRAVAGVDAVRAPVAQLRVEGARALQVAGVQLEMHHWCGGDEHDVWLFDRAIAENSSRPMISRRAGGHTRYRWPPPPQPSPRWSATSSMPPAAATRTPIGAWSSPTAASCTPTATGCSARSTTPRTPCRTRCCAPGAGCRASRGEARCAPGCTGSRPTRA